MENFTCLPPPPRIPRGIKTGPLFCRIAQKILNVIQPTTMSYKTKSKYYLLSDSVFRGEMVHITYSAINMPASRQTSVTVCNKALSYKTRFSNKATCVDEQEKTLANTRCSRRRPTLPSVPPPGELDETYASSLILAHSLHYVKNNVIHKTESTVRKILHCHQRTELRSQLALTRTENLVKFEHAVFEICEFTDKPTNRQTDGHAIHSVSQ